MAEDTGPGEAPDPLDPLAAILDDGILSGGVVVPWADGSRTPAQTGKPGNGLPDDLAAEVQNAITFLITHGDPELKEAGLALAKCGENGQQLARRLQGDITARNDTSPKAIVQAAREIEIVRLRLQGFDLRTIGRKLGMISPTTGQPQVSTVHKMLSRALQRWYREDVDELRNMEAARLDAITQRLWPIIEKEGGKGDDDRALRAIDRALAVADRRAKLFGLDAPTKTQTVFKGEVTEEVTVRIEAVEAVEEYLSLVDEVVATEHRYASAIEVEAKEKGEDDN